MIKNYIKIAFRNLFKHKVYSLINIFGLAIGMACSILILLWVIDELGVNKFHQKLDRIYSVMEYQYYRDEVNTIPNTPGILAPALKEEVPEIEHAVTITWNMPHLFTVGSNSFKENGIYARKNFFEIFSFDLLRGDPTRVLEKPQSVVLSRSLAEKYFGTVEEALGEAIVINQHKSYMVTGIFPDVPEHSTLKFDYVFPFEDWLANNQWATEWGNNGPMTYVTLREDASELVVEEKILNFIKERVEETDTELMLYPFTDIYLYSRFENKKVAGGRIEYVRLFSIVAFFILLIACINFMNLSTARSTKRAREVGIRKSIGASRNSLIAQYLGESIIISFFALFVALVLVEGFLPAFNDLTEKLISIDYGNIPLMSVFLGITLLTGIIAGSYPALYLSSFEAVKTLKGTIKSSFGEVFVRKGLVVFQFSLSVILIISTILIYNQIQYVQNKNLGYKIDNLIQLPIEGDLDAQWDLFKQELQQIPAVTSISRSGNTFLGRNSNTGGVSWPGKDPNDHVLFEMVRVDYDLLETMGIELAEGRSFSREFGADSMRVVVNQRALEVMNMENPLGKVLDIWGGEWEIIGVAEDFHFQQLQYNIEPLIFMLQPEATWNSYIRIRTDNTPQTLTDIEAVYKKINPDYPFDYRFMDQAYASLYRSETRIGSLAKYSAILAIIICCLGLFGLSTFSTEQRTKEIGIRKVLGASVHNLVLLLSKDFTKPVLAAVGIAVPVSWWLMDSWLSDYAYRTEISWWIFILAGALAIAVAWLTVSWQSIKAALMNPVDSLRSE